jgi:hypothetical protein
VTSRVRDVAGQAVVGLVAGVLIAAYVGAATDPLLIWSERSPSVWVPAAILSVGPAWQQRSRGPLVVIGVWAKRFGVVFAGIVAIGVLAVALHPWALTQAWIAPAVALVFGAAVAWALVRTARAEATPRRRRLAWAEAGLVAAFVVGVVLVIGTSGLAGVGAIAAVWAGVGLFVVQRLRVQSVLDGSVG